MYSFIDPEHAAASRPVYHSITEAINCSTDRNLYNERYRANLSLCRLDGDGRTVALSPKQTHWVLRELSRRLAQSALRINRVTENDATLKRLEMMRKLNAGEISEENYASWVKSTATMSGVIPRIVFVAGDVNPYYAANESAHSYAHARLKLLCPEWNPVLGGRGRVWERAYSRVDQMLEALFNSQINHSVAG